MRVGGVSRYERMLLGDAPQRVGAADEHKRALDREQQWVRTSRAQLSEEARQHHRVLAQIRDGAARDRRLHRSALRENRWLLALADRLLARQSQKR